jgi:hypothetical protein
MTRALEKLQSTRRSIGYSPRRLIFDWSFLTFDEVYVIQEEEVFSTSECTLSTQELLQFLVEGLHQCALSRQ